MHFFSKIKLFSPDTNSLHLVGRGSGTFLRSVYCPSSHRLDITDRRVKGFFCRTTLCGDFLCLVRIVMHEMFDLWTPRNVEIVYRKQIAKICDTSIFFWKILIEKPVILLAKYSEEGYEEIYLNLKKSLLLCIFLWGCHLHDDLFLWGETTIQMVLHNLFKIQAWIVLSCFRGK